MAMKSHPVERPHFLDFRATILLCVASVLLSVREFQGSDLSVLHMSYETWPEEPWRLLTSCLLHAGWIHLIFNIYWAYRFGSVLEPVLGLVPMIGVFVLLGVGSSATQWAFSGGGVGLSGIGYGLFGILWALDRYHPNFRGVIRDDIVKLFVIWFFVCIVATEIGAMRIGNIAHGTGAVMGGLLGLALSPLGMKRSLAWLILGSLALGISLASTVGRPYLIPARPPLTRPPPARRRGLRSRAPRGSKCRCGCRCPAHPARPARGSCTPACRRTCPSP